MPWRPVFILIALACALAVRADDLTATVFARTPEAAAGDLLVPRAVVGDVDANRLYVLDTGLQRVVAFAPEGRQTGAWPLATLGLPAGAPLPPDPLLPNPALAMGGERAFLLSLDRNTRQLTLMPVDETGTGREVTLPEGAGNGAVTLDPGGRVLAAYLRVMGGAAELVVAREQDDGNLTTLLTLPNACDSQTMNLTLTGMAVAPDGRLAIGIAQMGNPQYSFIRSWLAQATLGEEEAGTLKVTHRYALLDGRGKPVERFRTLVEMAGKPGFPAKASVPLFTSLALGAKGLVISGGHTQDPFLRLYAAEGYLLRAQPRNVPGGQQAAVLGEKGETRLFVLSTARRVEELSLDGRLVGGCGKAYPYDLAHPVALAADTEGVYVLTRAEGSYRLLRFDLNGRFLWIMRLTPPKGFEKATPFLAAPGTDRALIGWRQPETNGVGYVQSVMEDGLPGAPLWAEPFPNPGTADGPCDTPLLIGGNGRLYVLRQTKDGTRLQAYSSAGALLQSFPAAVQGITLVAADGSLAWVHPNGDGLVISQYSAQGEDRGWKRLLGSTKDSTFLPLNAGTLWGWLSNTESLFRIDAGMVLADEFTVTTPDGEKVTTPLAAATDRTGRRYLLLPHKLLVLKETRDED